MTIIKRRGKSVQTAQWCWNKRRHSQGQPEACPHTLLGYRKSAQGQTTPQRTSHYRLMASMAQQTEQVRCPSMHFRKCSQKQKQTKNSPLPVCCLQQRPRDCIPTKDPSAIWSARETESGGDSENLYFAIATKKGERKKGRERKKRKKEREKSKRKKRKRERER